MFQENCFPNFRVSVYIIKNEKNIFHIGNTCIRFLTDPIGVGNNESASEMTTERNEEVDNNNQQTPIDDEDEDLKFERYLKWYIGYKQDELALMNRRKERAEYQLKLEEEINKNMVAKLEESRLKVESLEVENMSLKNQLAVAEGNNDSCLQCDMKSTLKCRKLKFCSTSCLQRMVADLKSAGLS